MRTYAIWGARRLILVFLVALTLVSINLMYTAIVKSMSQAMFASASVLTQRFLNSLTCKRRRFDLFAFYSYTIVRAPHPPVHRIARSWGYLHTNSTFWGDTAPIHGVHGESRRCDICAILSEICSDELIL